MGRLTRSNINVDPDTDRFLHATIGGKEIDWKQCRDSTLNVLINGPTSNGFGKTVFLTREEAEKALEEREGKKDG